MRKAVLIFLIILVSVGIGFILFMQFTATSVTYCGTDKNVVYEGSSLSISNKYYTNISQDEILSAIDAVENGAEGAETAYNAILAKGTPVFHPTFYIEAIDNGTDYFRVSGKASDEPLDGQKQIGYTCTDLNLTVATDGNSKILAMSNYAPTELKRESLILPVISSNMGDGKMICGDDAYYDIVFAFDGGVTSSTVTFVWTFNVKNSSLFNLSGIDEQVLVADVTFSTSGPVLSAQFA